MVCKENVVSWFGNLSSYKRIDVMCTLLNMCLPFEVRYLGTCVEDLGKRDYNVLRDTEHRANNVSDLAELKLNMTDKRTRRKLALYMALLHSCNYSCAVVLHENLSNFDFQEISNLLNGTSFSPDDQPLEELLLLYTMALNHPAFSYEQKSTFGNIFLKLQEEEARLNIPKSGSISYKATQGCIPCVNQNDRIDSEISTNCVVAPPPIQNFQGEMPLRGNAMIAGVPPAIGIPPTGLCIPSPEQMAMHGAGHPQYVHVGFPSVNHMPPWAGQVVMGHNQFMYHQGDVLPYATNSPLVSRQSSPIHSQSHSRSNSPTGGGLQRKNSNNASSNNGGLQQQPRTSCQVTPSTSNTLTTSTSTSSSQTNITNSSTALPGTAMPLPSLPPLNTSRSLPNQAQQSQQPIPTLRPLAPMSNVYTRHSNDSATTATSKQQPPPPRLKLSLSGEALRESGNKEMPNFKSNFQNCSNNEIRRLSDEDISKIDMTSNVLNNMKSQAANGLNQTPEKKIDCPNSIHSTNEPIDNEIVTMENIQNDNMKPVAISDHAMMNVYHPQNHTTMTNMRRYPPPLDQPTHIQMFPAPPSIYPPNACYGCLTTVPMAGIQNRFSRCNGPPVYCLTQLQSLRLEPENSRHSHSSSSDSTGSRSPPETPPAAPWTGNDNQPLPASEQQQQQQPQQHLGGGPPPLHSISSTHSCPHPHQQLNQQERTRARKSHAQMMRHKSGGHSSMVNGGAPPPPPPTSLQPCMTFPAPPGHTPMTAYLPHHFPTLRPTTGIYTNFTHAYAAARPGYPTLAYQPNGEMMYQYPGHHPPPPPPPGSNSATAATGTPPPPSVAVAAAAAAAAVQSTPNPVQQQQQPQQQPQQQSQPPPQQQQNYVPAPVVTYAPVNATQPPPPTHPSSVLPAKLSCYNCGSSSHTAIDCKEQTMEDITRRAQYRLDYATLKSSGSEQSQSSDK